MAARLGDPPCRVTPADTFHACPEATRAGRTAQLTAATGPGTPRADGKQDTREHAMEDRLDSILSAYEGKREELIPILQNVQEECGYLSEQAMLGRGGLVHGGHMLGIGLATTAIGDAPRSGIGLLMHTGSWVELSPKERFRSGFDIALSAGILYAIMQGIN